MKIVVLSPQEVDALSTGTATPSVQVRAAQYIQYLIKRYEEDTKPVRLGSHS